MLVYQNIKKLPAKEQQHFIWDKIIYANPIKDFDTLTKLDRYKPLVTYDNREEVMKVKKYAPQAGLVLRIKVPNTGAVVELSSKFGASSGEAVDLIEAAFQAGLVVEGLSFHVGSQCTNFENYVQALHVAQGIFQEAWSRGYEQVKILDIGGGFPAPYDENVLPFQRLAKTLNSEFDRLFPPHIEILAEPGRFLVATAGTSGGQSHRQGRPRRETLLLHQRRGLPHVFGRDFRSLPLSPEGLQERADADLLGLRPDLRRAGHHLAGRAIADLDLHDLVYSENIGAYSHASSTYFNGFPPAKVIHINQ